jgi:VWFA-related protein
VDSPLTVALLVDVSGSVAAVIPAEKEAAARFFEQVLRPRDQALLAGFAQYIAVWQDLTPSISAVQEALARAAPFSQEPDHGLGVRPRGGTLLNDAVTLVASQKLKTLAGRKAMVLITDGMDNGSIANEKKAVEAAQQADAVIYGIRYEDPRFRRMGGGMPAPAAPLDHGLGSLERLASPTGGRAFDAMRKGGVEAAFDAIGEEMRNQYGIGFAPDAKAPGEPQFHKLEVKVRRRGLKAQTRGGYYR